MIVRCMMIWVAASQVVYASTTKVTTVLIAYYNQGNYSLVKTANDGKYIVAHKPCLLLQVWFCLCILLNTVYVMCVLGDGVHIISVVQLCWPLLINSFLPTKTQCVWNWCYISFFMLLQLCNVKTCISTPTFDVRRCLDNKPLMDSLITLYTWCQRHSIQKIDLGKLFHT